MHINNLPVRWMGQRHGANYADPYQGEHVTPYLSIAHAKEDLEFDRLGETGDTILLWSVSADMSKGECVSATRTDAAEADRILTLGPRRGVKVERV